MRPIPVSAAERIAREYGYDQVIIIGRKVGDVVDQAFARGEHLTTCTGSHTRALRRGGTLWQLSQVQGHGLGSQQQMKWRGVEVENLDDATLVDAFEQGLAILQELMQHMQCRNPVRQEEGAWQSRTGMRRCKLVASTGQHGYLANHKAIWACRSAMKLCTTLHPAALHRQWRPPGYQRPLRLPRLLPGR